MKNKGGCPKGTQVISRARGPNNTYKIRRLNSVKNKTGECFGITIPVEAAQQFSNTKFRFETSGNCLLFIGEGSRA